MVESRGDLDAVGDGGRAIGPYQIHQVYWDDAAQFDPTLTYGGKTYWSCRGPGSKEYSERVMQVYYAKYILLIKSVQANPEFLVHEIYPTLITPSACLEETVSVAEVGLEDECRERVVDISTCQNVMFETRNSVPGVKFEEEGRDGSVEVVRKRMKKVTGVEDLGSTSESELDVRAASRVEYGVDSDDGACIRVVYTDWKDKEMSPFAHCIMD